MEKFKYKFSAVLYVLMGLGVAIAIACLIMNIIRCVNLFTDGNPSGYDIISFVLPMLISVAFIVIIASLLYDSSYCFESQSLVLKFGFIKNRFDYSKIKQIVYFKSSNKLTVYYTDESFTNIVIKDADFEIFAKTLVAHNEKINYYENLDS